MKAFRAAKLRPLGVSAAHCPTMRSFGYSASSVLLLSHIRYLRRREGDERQLCDAVGDWLIGGGAFRSEPLTGSRWFKAWSDIYKARMAMTWVQWIVVFLLLAALGTVSAFGLLDALEGLIAKLPGWMRDLALWLAPSLRITP